MAQEMEGGAKTLIKEKEHHAALGHEALHTLRGIKLSKMSPYDLGRTPARRRDVEVLETEHLVKGALIAAEAVQWNSANQLSSLAQTDLACRPDTCPDWEFCDPGGVDCTACGLVAWNLLEGGGLSSVCGMMGLTDEGVTNCKNACFPLCRNNDDCADGFYCNDNCADGSPCARCERCELPMAMELHYGKPGCSEVSQDFQHIQNCEEKCFPPCAETEPACPDGFHCNLNEAGDICNYCVDPKYPFPAQGGCLL